MSDQTPYVTRDEAQDIAELAAREYFETYLREVFPRQQRAIQEHTHTMIKIHDMDQESHDGVVVKVNKMIWVFLGVAFAGGFAGEVARTLFGAM